MITKERRNVRHCASADWLRSICSICSICQRCFLTSWLHLSRAWLYTSRTNFFLRCKDTHIACHSDRCARRSHLRDLGAGPVAAPPRTSTCCTMTEVIRGTARLRLSAVSRLFFTFFHSSLVMSSLTDCRLARFFCASSQFCDLMQSMNLQSFADFIMCDILYVWSISFYRALRLAFEMYHF